MHNQPTIALHQLHSECSTPLEDILRRLLSLGSTQQALAQIVDGIPTRDNYFGPPDSMWYQRHPDIAAHVISSEEASSSTSQFCSQLDLKTINVTATVAECYQQTTKSSSETQTRKALRFLEISSSVLHDVISNVYNHFHSDKHEIAPAQSVHYWRCVHRRYTWGANYKNSFGSTAAYWAETLIFGGPVLFRRGEDGQQCDAAYIHPRDGDIVELTQSQILQYMAAASSPDDKIVDLSSLLPFSIDPDARRLTIKEAIAENIYREPGQLDKQWGDGKKYGWRLNSRKNCRIRIQPDDADANGPT